MAIIVILAIIAVITVPIILNIIENSRKGAATDSAYGYKDAVNKAYIQELAKPNNGNLKLNGIYVVQSDGTLNADTGSNFGVTNYTNLPVSVSGDKPSSGKLRYSNNVLNAGCLVIGDYKVTFDGNTATTVKGDCEDYEFPSENSGSSSNNGGNTTQKTWNYYHFLDEESYGATTSEFNNSWVVWTQENTDTNDVEVCRKIDDTTICVEPGHYTEVTCNGDNCSVSEYLSNIKTELESHDLECDVSKSRMNCSNILIYDFSEGYAEFDDDSGAYCAIYGFETYCGH